MPHSDQQISSIRTYFAKLGLEAEIADIYLALYSSGPQTISAVSRISGIERTRIYRLLPTLTSSGLIEVQSKTKSGILRAAPIANIAILISKREQELKSLQDELQLIEQLLARTTLDSPLSRVQFYTGAEGAKQMLWNETKSRTEVLGIIHEAVQLNTGDRFFDRWAQRCNEQKLQFRGIVSDTFLSKRQESSGSYHLDTFEGRYISPEVFRISHSIFTYDTVTAYYNWKDGEIFGIEVYNKDIADTQRQMFELLWKQAQPLAKV